MSNFSSAVDSVYDYFEDELASATTVPDYDRLKTTWLSSLEEQLDDAIEADRDERGLE